MLTIITPTGERPAAFEFCQRMMARQTYEGAVRWIIVDDGREPSPLWFTRAGWDVEIIRPSPLWAPGENTQGRNLLAALERVGGGDVLTIVEDDDYYAPGWLQWIADHASAAELIGEAEAVYYNVRARTWRAIGNDAHASLRCSAMRDGAIETFRSVLATPYRYYDLRLWRRHADSKVFPRRLTVGIKGMPGRPGIALGHDGKGRFDQDGAKLRELIGDDADRYLPYFKEPGMQKLIVIKPFRYNKRDWRVGEEFIPVKRIDGELHVHAKKVELREAPASKPKAETPPRTLKVETQTEKLAGATLHRSSEAAAPKQEKAEESQKPAPTPKPAPAPLQAPARQASAQPAATKTGD